MKARWWAACAAVVALLAAGHAQAADKIKIGVLKLVSSGPIFIAQEKGYFAAEGLDAELVYFEAAQPISVAAVSGDIDVGITGLTAGFYNLAGKGALKIVAAQSREEKGYHLNAYLASPQAYEAGLKSFKDFRGKSVAITQTGSTFHYSLGLLAEKYKFPLSENRLVALQSLPNMVSALKGNQVEALVIPATIAVPMIERGEAKLLGWVGDETPWQLGASFATPKTITERRTVVQRYVTAYRKAAKDFYDAFLQMGADGNPKNGPEADALLAILSKFTGQTPASIRPGIPFVDPEARLLVDDIYHQVEWYQSQGLVDKAVEAKAIVDLSFVQGHMNVPK